MRNRYLAAIAGCLMLLVPAVSHAKSYNGDAGYKMKHRAIRLNGWTVGHPGASAPHYGAGCTTVLLSRLTAVCDSNRPLIDAPVAIEIAVWLSITPSVCVVVPRRMAPAE